MEWISVDDRLPEPETPVLCLWWNKEKQVIGELVWERPSYEETFDAFLFWDNPENDGQDWEWSDITHWMPLPEPPQ